MGEKSKVKVPKRIGEFKLSKGTRKDLRKLLAMIEQPDTRAQAMGVGTGLVSLLAERFALQELDRLCGSFEQWAGPGRAH